DGEFTENTTKPYPKTLKQKSLWSNVMDEIDYFPKRDKFKVKKDAGSDWNKLKKQKTIQPGKAKPSKSSPEEEVKKK
ncbi:MAG: hypothetical protein MK234_03700, partial [Nitrospinales bacterium]|nr:hypothetical protein [Nitrospinales bacterium]